jgi:FAD/FMN-containing dehydrogenase
MITAKGKLITVSKDSNPELFWGIRGAGANFGVFVSATYKLHPLRNNGKLLSADMFFSAAQSSDYFKLVESLNNRLPAEMASVTLIMWDGTKNEVGSCDSERVIISAC